MDDHHPSALGGPITIERARAGDGSVLLAIHEDVARWLWE
jgi:hypothetical protein